MSKRNNGPVIDDDSNLAEEVLKHGGKSADEVARTGAIDRAEDEYEKSLDPKFRTENSPVHQAVWGGNLPINLFKRQGDRRVGPAPYQSAMDNCVEVLKSHIAANTLFDSNNKVSDQVLFELAEAGYFGMLVQPDNGGSGASVVDFMEFITRVAAEGDATVAGLNSIHECIGAVDPLEGSGTEEQQKKYLPILASGKRLSAFALTEPGAGSDLTAVRTTAVLNGDFYEVTGEKLFISNVVPGRIIGLVVKIDGKHNVLIAELPDQENDSFRLVPYGIHAVQHIHNQGIKFNKFLVPKENLLKVVNPATGEREMGKGLLIAYHGLNRGRVALCANASGVMRTLLESMRPWAQFRKTYGQPIEKRELVTRRIARTASLIVGADALRDWCSSLLDEGYRGELECIIAKIFAADALAEVAIKALKTHGGRSFLKGHIVGDNLHDLFAPSIYEGENEMLAMAFFKGLSKEVGTKYMGPLMGVMAGAGVDMKAISKPGSAMFKELLKVLKSPKALWGMTKAGLPLLGWALRTETRRGGFGAVEGVNPLLQRHAKFARKNFASLNKVFYRNMLLNGVALADMQDLMVDELSMTIQKTVVIAVTCLHATEKGDEATLAAADVLCTDLTRELTRGKKTAKDRRAARKLAQMVLDGKFTQLLTTAKTEILRPYKA